MSEVLQTYNLSKRFRKTVVLDRLNLTVSEGSVYGLLGQNGAGKSTAIKILMNLIQPSEGRAELFGHDSRHLTPKDFTQIGYVSENQELPDWMTVEYFMSYLARFYSNWDAARAEELLRQFDLPKDRKLKHLSRGMRMKASLASSLAYKPKLIILDEPFSGLDALVRDQFVESLLESMEGATVLISSHDLAEIENFASHVGYLDQGRLLFSEEMSSLTARFREIQITRDGPMPPLSNWPSNWISAEHSGAVTRFVDTSFHKEHSIAQIHQLFQGAHEISLSPMPLRSIFVTLAKTGQKGA
jgi:ABC-2 type transport system ATP-binding protein